MTVQTPDSRIEHQTNGTTVDFAVPFPFLEDTDLVVLLVDDTTGEETTLVLTTDYTVDGAGEEAGTVTTVETYDAGYTLVIYREVPVTQESDYTANGPLPAETLERGFDKLTMICADLLEQLRRVLTFPVGIGTDDIDTVLPYPEANHLIGWNSASPWALVNYLAADVSDLVISEFMDDFLHCVDAAEARELLDVVGLDDLGPLATWEPTGTPSANTLLRGDESWSDEINGMPLGYRRIAWTQANANDTLELADYTAGVGWRKDSTATPSWTIPANSAVAFPIGTMIPLANVGASGDVTLAITDDTLQRAGSTSTGSVTLEPGFFGGIEKVNTTHWVVFGAFP